MQVRCIATCKPCLSAFPYKPVNWIGLGLRKSPFLFLMSSSGFYAGCYERTQGLSAACHHVTLNALPLLLGRTKYQQEQKLSEVRVNLLLLLMMLLDHLPVLLLNMANEKAHKVTTSSFCFKVNCCLG